MSIFSDAVSVYAPGVPLYDSWNSSTRGRSWRDQQADVARRKRLNTGATDFASLAPGSQKLLDRYAAWKGTGDESKTARLEARLKAAGVDLSKFGGAGSADAGYLQFANAGARGARSAAFIRNNSTVAANLAEADKAAGLANTAIPDDINQSFQSTLNQIAAMTGGDPSSPATQAAAAQVLAQRFGSLDRAKLDIQQNLANTKIGIRNQGNQFDQGLLTSIGDTIEMLKAQKEADQMARYQLGAGIFGGVASLGLGIGRLVAGGAGAAAGASNRGQSVLSPVGDRAYPAYI